MKIAKIIGSNSHIDYIGRIIDALDVDDPPSTEDYGFAQFVALPVSEREEIVGIIYNSQLINPDYGQFGPRLSPPADLSLLSPDYLNERGVLIGILIVGWRRSGESSQAGVPRRVIPVGQDVHRMTDDKVQRFHKDAQDHLHLHYYSQVIAHAGAFAVPLIEAVIAQLEPSCTQEERQRLCVLKKSLVWQRTMGGMRL